MDQNQENEAKGQKAVDIDIDDNIVEGKFSNLFLVSHSPEHFVFDFATNMPGMQKAKVHSRVILTPAHARRIYEALGNSIKNYQESHGDIHQTDATHVLPGFGAPVAQA